MGHLPPGAAIRADAGSVALKLSYDEAGVPNGFEQGTPDATDLVIAFADARTVKISNRSPQRIKVDLWISRSGQRFFYTSSCPIAPGSSSFEMWPSAVPWIYVSNPRILPAGAPTGCK